MEKSTNLNNRLPFGNTKIVLSILAILTSPFFIGFIFGVLALYLAGKDSAMLQSDPIAYGANAKTNHKRGIILAWSGFLLSLVLSGFVLYLFLTYGTVDPYMIEQLKNSQVNP